MRFVHSGVYLFYNIIDNHVNRLTGKMVKICCNISIQSLKNIAVIIDNFDLNVFQLNIMVIFFFFFFFFFFFLGGGGAIFCAFSKQYM